MIKKDAFISAIEALREQADKDKIFTESLNRIFDTDVMPLYNNSLLSKTVIGLLSTQFDIVEIERFCYELDFGRNVGADITSAESLWNHVELL